MRGAESVLGALALCHVELIKDLLLHLVLEVVQVSESRESSVFLQKLV